MNVVTAVAVFAVIFPAELPDKTMVASLVLGTRFRPGLVWCGVALAFLAHVTIAVTAGGLLSLLPHWIVQAVAAALFAVGAIVLLRESLKSARETAEDEAAEEARENEEIDRADKDRGTSTLKVISTGFIVVFVAEWGDLTQILTATLAARYHDPLSVAVGAVAALWAVAAIGVFAGRTLLRVVPIHLVQRIAAGILFLLAVLTVIEIVA